MILDTIAEASRIRVAKAKSEFSLEQLKDKIYDGAGVRSFNSRTAFAFEKALKKRDNLPEVNNYKDSVTDANKSEDSMAETSISETSISEVNISKDNIAFICEVKKASPSKGIIAEDFPYLKIAKEYESAGANAISVLTEPEFFKGSDNYLTEISDVVHIPVLRKDFTVDEYQIYEAKAIGADAVLLICSLLDTETIKTYIKLCNELGLSALVEAHTEEEVISAINAGARVIGVNNRNLQTFEVDLNNSVKLRNLVPKDIVFVAESGIKTADDMLVLKEAGVNSVLIGETLMRSSNKKELLNQLRV